MMMMMMMMNSSPPGEQFQVLSLWRSDSRQSWRSRATRTARNTQLTQPADWKLTSSGLSDSWGSFARVRMGCAISGSGLTPRTQESRNTEDESPARLTPRHIHLIKESWKVIQEDIAKVGIIMFVRWELPCELLQLISNSRLFVYRFKSALHKLHVWFYLSFVMSVSKHQRENKSTLNINNR